VRYVLILLLLEIDLSWGGISKSAIAIPEWEFGGFQSVIDDVEEAKVQNTLHEAGSMRRLWVGVGAGLYRRFV